MGDILVLLFCAFQVFSQVVQLNDIQSTTTKLVIMAWKERIAFMQWKAQGQIPSVSSQRVQIDNYFNNLLAPLDFFLSWIESNEVPMSFFTVPVTYALEKRIIALATPILFSLGM